MIPRSSWEDRSFTQPKPTSTWDQGISTSTYLPKRYAVVGISYAQLKFEGFHKRTKTIVAFYQEYSRYRYLYFTTRKQWIKILIVHLIYILTNTPTRLK